MDNVSRSPEHPSDVDLLERLFARERHPHLADCADCARRAETLARAIDPSRATATEAPFDELFFRRQAERVRTRIAAGEGRDSSLHTRLAMPGLAWAGIAAAALIALAIGLHRPAPLRHVDAPPAGEALTVASAANGFASAQDRADDRLLRDVDEVFGP